MIGVLLYGVSLACLMLLLTACASNPMQLSDRVVITCPPELVYRPDRVLPELPKAATNDDLWAYASRLLTTLAASWDEAERVAAECRTWIEAQK